MGFKCVFIYVDWGGIVYFQKIFQSAAMVVVSVGENTKVNGSKVYAEGFTVFQKNIALSCIKEDFFYHLFQYKDLDRAHI